jgi:hypothetical protein
MQINHTAKTEVHPGRDMKVHGHPGEKHWAARLTNDDVLIARKMYQPWSRKWGARALAKRFGVSSTAMQYAISGKGWQHL